MRKGLVALGLTFVLASSLAAQRRTQTDEVAGRLHQLYAAWGSLDPAKAAPFYAKDADLMFFDIAPMKYNGWSEYAAGVPKAFAAYKSGKFTLNEDLRTHHQGNLAWACGTW